MSEHSTSTNASQEKSIDDGGPAFPVSWPNPNVPEAGMSLRDYFAAHAPPQPSYYFKHFHAREVAKAKADDRYIMRGEVVADCQWRYEWADAMLAARGVK